ncbi:cell division protein FtsZ [Kamptonema cortianum]|nr:cell division protein FtsZ [Geitlerinema splendidum]MDK3162172.1 cell division protein FtsZ [Kamptonema cortianum]
MSPLNLFETQAVIKVIGVGGGGCNAVNRMVQAGVHGVEFIVMNTDRQALDSSLADTRIPLGVALTRGLGTGGDPSRGEAAAKESEKQILEILEGADMVFITAGMGGGTGTGSAPFVAELAKRLDILTVGVVTRPFLFEGPRRKSLAKVGAEKLQEHVDTLILISNDKILDVVDKRATMQDAFKSADDVLLQGVQGVSDIITKPGMMNVDFADVRSVMHEAGVALMGMGRASGEHRARHAAEAAASSPMLETTIQGAKKLLVNITAGPDFSIGEARDAMEFINQLSDADEAEIFMGTVVDESMGDDVSVTLLAAGMDTSRRRETESSVFPEQEVVTRSAEPQPSAPRAALKPIDMSDIEELDIPTFLRRQRSRT